MPHRVVSVDRSYSAILNTMGLLKTYLSLPSHKAVCDRTLNASSIQKGSHVQGKLHTYVSAQHILNGWLLVVRMELPRLVREFPRVLCEPDSPCGVKAAARFSTSRHLAAGHPRPGIQPG